MAALAFASSIDKILIFTQSVYLTIGNDPVLQTSKTNLSGGYNVSAIDNNPVLRFLKQWMYLLYRYINSDSCNSSCDSTHNH